MGQAIRTQLICSAGKSVEELWLAFSFSLSKVRNWSATFLSRNRAAASVSSCYFVSRAGSPQGALQGALHLTMSEPPCRACSPGPISPLSLLCTFWNEERLILLLETMHTCDINISLSTFHTYLLSFYFYLHIHYHKYIW